MWVVGYVYVCGITQNCIGCIQLYFIHSYWKSRDLNSIWVLKLIAYSWGENFFTVLCTLENVYEPKCECCYTSWYDTRTAYTFIHLVCMLIAHCCKSWNFSFNPCGLVVFVFLFISGFMHVSTSVFVCVPFLLDDFARAAIIHSDSAENWNRIEIKQVQIVRHYVAVIPFYIPCCALYFAIFTLLQS